MSQNVFSNASALLAINYAQGDAYKASEEEVQKAGYFINRSFFIPEELERAKRFFVAKGLLSYHSSTYLISPKFKVFLEKYPILTFFV